MAIAGWAASQSHSRDPWQKAYINNYHIESTMKLLWFVVIIQSIALGILFYWNHELRNSVYCNKVVAKEIVVEAIRLEKGGGELGSICADDYGSSLSMYSADKMRSISLICDNTKASMKLFSGGGLGYVDLCAGKDKLCSYIHSSDGGGYGVFYDRHPSWEKPYWTRIAPQQSDIFDSKVPQHNKPDAGVIDAPPPADH